MTAGIDAALKGLVQRVSLGGLKPHHIGREFVGDGILHGVALSASGYTAHFVSPEGSLFVSGTGEESLHYWIDQRGRS